MEKPDWRKQRRKSGGGVKIVNGRIYARVQYQDETTGTRKEKLRPAENRTHARELVRQMREELARGGSTALQSDKLRFEQVAERFKKLHLVPPVFRNGLKVSGKRSYKEQTYLLKAVVGHFGHRNMRSLRPSDIEEFKSTRLRTPVVIMRAVKKPNPEPGRRKFVRELVPEERPRSIASVHRELSLLRQIFVFAETEDLISRNPFGKVKRLISSAAEVQRDRVLGQEEEIRILAACEAAERRHIRPLIITAIDTAMRRGELLKLTWSDVDFRGGFITVQATNSKTERKRIVGMTARVRSELQELLFRAPPSGSVPVFGISSNFKRSWTTALRIAGCTDLHFHDLRHTAITRMIRAGVSISEAMKISGHSEMKTFQRYVNLTGDSVSASAVLLDRYNEAASPIETEVFS